MARGITRIRTGGDSRSQHAWLTTGTAGPLPIPEQVEDRLIEPVLAASVALNPLYLRVEQHPGRIGGR